MIKYLAGAKECIVGIKNFAIWNICINLNQKVDILSKLALVAFNHITKEVLVKVLSEPLMDRKEINVVVEEEEDNWMTPIIRCLEEGVWSEDKNEARALRMNINQYVLEGGVLFKKYYLVPMLRCVGPLQANYVIMEIHMGACGMHSGPRSVVAKAIRQGYYCITMHEIQNFDSCQIYAPWIGDKLLVRITRKEVKKFVLDNIVCRFGLPRVIVIDNETQFVNDPFKSWCERLNIQQMNTVVAHPQANGLIEMANKSLIEDNFIPIVLPTTDESKRHKPRDENIPRRCKSPGMSPSAIGQEMKPYPEGASHPG
ncbi:reverse transcriptase domain-containing protein [Tanacetum coccineum]|uniref:Reverse transcriptase domain-containing protein n=1 Tax=Tanacetum coccineum TaxID=301880 RepID=A0ABQ5AF63_9ASTR